MAAVSQTIESHQLVSTADGNMETFVVHPASGGPHPAVVMYQNVGGLSESLRAMARRIAEHDYYCALPDLYYRLGRVVIDPDSTDEDALAIRAIAGRSVSVPFRVVDDTKALLSYIDNDPSASEGPKGAIGYCMGGFFAPLVAGILPDIFKAVVSLYGTRMLDDVPDAPYRVFDHLQGEVYFGLAERDPRTPPEFADKLRNLLGEASLATWQVEVYEGTDHGFAVPGRRVYDQAASERAWKRAFAIFERQLR